MSNIPSFKQYIQLEATEFRDAVSESLLQAMGGSINFLLDKTLVTNINSYTSPGSFSLVSPSAQTLLLLYGCGGGAGGGGGGSGQAGTFGGGGGGGGSAGLWELQSYLAPPSTTLNITVGSGGTAGAAGSTSNGGNGTDGGDTLVVVSGVTLFSFAGGNKGLGGTYNMNPDPGGNGGLWKYPGKFAASGASISLLGPAGNGGTGTATNGTPGGSTPGASGGAAGVGGLGAGGGGAGGGSQFSPGGTGGTGEGSVVGTIGGNGGLGAGGGGGGGGRGDTTRGFAGGNGGSGFLYVFSYSF